MTKKNFCALPFHHTKIDVDGSYAVCCLHRVPTEHRRNIQDTTAVQWFNSDYMQQVRQHFVDEQQHPGCHECWDREKHGQKSMRSKTQKEYEILGVDISSPRILNIELQPSNLCNLSCLMCNENNSSVIQAENQRLGISLINPKDLKWNDLHYNNLHELLNQGFRVLNVLGGEPFYNKKLLEVLESLDSALTSRAVLQIFTNASFYNEQWKAVLSKFGLVRLVFSIDGVRDVYEYIRYPGVWATVDQNVASIKTMARAKCMVNCIVQNLNILYLDQLIDWCVSQQLHLELSLVHVPSYFKITNLPDSTKQQAIEKLAIWINQYHEPHVNKSLVEFKQILQDSLGQFDQHQWQLFKDQVELRDSVRGNSWGKLLPGLA